MLSGMEGQVLEILLLALVLCCILVGSNQGLFISLYNMVKNILIVAATIGVSPVITKRLPEDMIAKEGVGALIAFAVSFVILNIIGRLIKVMDDIEIVSGINKLAGAIFGALTGVVIVWTILGILGALQAYDWCEPIVKSARENDVIMWFQGCNPVASIFKNFEFPVI